MDPLVAIGLGLLELAGFIALVMFVARAVETSPRQHIARRLDDESGH